ncbi:unnamed protein product, partial [Cladocopium goreaui]
MYSSDSPPRVGYNVGYAAPSYAAPVSSTPGAGPPAGMAVPNLANPSGLSGMPLPATPSVQPVGAPGQFQVPNREVLYGPPPALTSGLPDPTSVERQKENYLTSLEEQ